jgi:epoxide hydrolase-like predicted phosphatase
MRIKAIVWDLGGVIVRTEDYSPREALAEEFGRTRLELEHIVFSSEAGRRAQLGEISAGQLWRSAADELGLPYTEIDRLQAAFWKGDQLDQELVDYIRRLRDGYRVVLLSNAFATLRSFLQETWKIADAFHHIVISGEVGLMKPDARIYQLMLDRAGVAPKEAVFLDDFPENIAGAQALGIRAIHFRQPAQALSELRAIIGDV